MQLAIENFRIPAIILWVSIPTVMYGGYSLLRLLQVPGKLTPFQQQYFRAGHAHAGVLLLMALLYLLFENLTRFNQTQAVIATILVATGILAQSGGFFLHMAIGQPGKASAGTAVTTAGAILLVAAIAFLVYGLIVA